jgi:hypothetical protein
MGENVVDITLGCDLHGRIVKLEGNVNVLRWSLIRALYTLFRNGRIYTSYALLVCWWPFFVH